MVRPSRISSIDSRGYFDRLAMRPNFLPRGWNPRKSVSVKARQAQHFDLLALMKLLTEFTTPAASGMIVASCAGEGLDGSALIALAALSIDVLMAFVSLGKSLLAELTSAVAALWTFSACVLKSLTLLLGLRLVSPPIAF